MTFRQVAIKWCITEIQVRKVCESIQSKEAMPDWIWNLLSTHRKELLEDCDSINRKY